MRLVSTNGLADVSPIRPCPVHEAFRWLWQFLIGAVVVVIADLPFAVLGPGAERPKPTESQVEVAYLYNFGKFVQWPANAAGMKSDFFNICVYGQDPFGSTLYTTVADGMIGGKRVVGKRIVDAEEAIGCQILFISSSESARVKKILDALNKAAVLTVSDMPQFSQRGGMIQFILEGNKVRFEVDLTAAQNAGLTLSSELLRVAAAVKRDPSPGG